MNIKEIAAKLLKLREERMTAFIMTGQLREELGFEGYSEALRQRWIQPDEEGSGMITITNNLGKVAEIRELARQYAQECRERCCTCGKNKCSCDGRCDACNGEKCTCESLHSVRESASFAMAHASRTKMTLAEAATLGLGHQQDQAGAPIVGISQKSAPVAPASISTPDAASPNKPQALSIGSDVRVVENGKTYVGKVSQVKPDGKMQISFGGEKPSTLRDYDKSEVSPATDAAQ